MRSKRHQIYMLLTGDILAASMWGAHPLLYNKPRTEILSKMRGVPQKRKQKQAGFPVHRLLTVRVLSLVPLKILGEWVFKPSS